MPILDNFHTWMMEHVPLWAYLKVLFEGAVHNELQAVMPLAAQVVAQIAADPSLLTGADKRNAALAKLGEDLARASITAAASTLNLAVELAVQNLKAKPA